MFTIDYENPQEQEFYTDDDFEEGITSIYDVKKLYKANGGRPYKVEGACVIKGQVTTSDQVGNLYKTLYIQDGTAGIELKLGKNGLYNEYKIGQWVYVNCSGLTVGNYRGMINIGYEDPTGEYETGYLEHAYIIDNHIFKGEMGKPLEPKVLTEADLSVIHKANDKKELQHLGSLVTIKDLKYADEIFILAYIDPNGDRKDYGGNCIFIDEDWHQPSDKSLWVNTWACSETKWKEYLNSGIFDGVEAGGGTVADYKNEDGTYNIGSMAYSISQSFKMGSVPVAVRSSGYARFSDTRIPQEVLDGTATVSFTGILTVYDEDIQFTLIDLDGVKKADGTPWY